MQAEQQSENERFEAWAEKAGFIVHRDETAKYIDYHKVTTRHAWNAWQARAALSHPRTPQGWKLVPVEPTQEMVQAIDKVMWPGASEKAYSAMLGAVSPPPEQGSHNV